MIDRVRYVLAVVSVITLPPGLLYWFVIHPWARQWRKLGPIRTYLIVVPVVFAFGALLFRVRARLLGADLGMHWGLVSIGAVLCGISNWIALQHWKHLSIATMVGIPELSPTEQHKGKLLKDGIYRVVRHPRYLSAGIAVIAVALFVDYVGVYVLILLLFPLGYPMLVFEERDLVDRFGEEYRQYQREVPCILPRWRRAK
jgi:protein-S-isoprenylcysteine O-methyltransferase Ste14